MATLGAVCFISDFGNGIEPIKLKCLRFNDPIIPLHSNSRNLSNGNTRFVSFLVSVGSYTLLLCLISRSCVLIEFGISRKEQSPAILFAKGCCS